MFKKKQTNKKTLKDKEENVEKHQFHVTAG